MIAGTTLAVEMIDDYQKGPPLSMFPESILVDG